jgi:hypothetical protein
MVAVGSGVQKLPPRARLPELAIHAAHVDRAEIERALLKHATAWEAYDYLLPGA